MAGASSIEIQTKRSLVLELEVGRVDLLFRQNIAGWIALMINSAAYTYLGWGYLPHGFLVPWYAILNTSAILRIFASLKWNRVRGEIRSPEQLRPWSLFIFAVLLVSGACWGAIGWHFTDSTSPLHQVFSTLLIAGMTAGALASYASLLPAMFAVLFPAMIPWIVRLALEPAPVYRIMAALCVLYTVLMVRLGRNLNSYVEAALRLTIEKERTTIALRESEERYRLALESSGTMGWNWDVESDSFAFQGNIRSVLGRSSFEGTFEDALSFIHPDDRERCSSVFRVAAETGQSLYAEARILWPDGSTHHVVTRGQGIRDQSGRHIRVTGICVDVTAEKMQEQLRRERDVLDAANKAKSVFLANASHEIRTPLAAVNGFAEVILQHGNLPEESMREVQLILRNGKYLSSLVNDLLDLSKIETGGLFIQKGPTFPKRELEDSIQLVKSAIEDKNLALTLTYSTPIPEWIESDSTRFRQIMINLLSNSVKFTNSGSVQVKVAFEPDQKHGGTLRVTIADTGIGMSDYVQRNLFQPFFRGETAEAQRVQGSGLGLALSRNLAKCLGGDLRLLSSAPGAGTTFELTVRTAKVASVETISHPPAEPAAPKETTRLQGLRILVVDDAADLRILMRRYLEREGASVDTCNNGADGTTQALHTCYDVVLMDIKMPVMDGYAATAALRKKNYERPIIALTAHASDDDQVACMKAGFDGYLRKPVDFVQLVETLKQEIVPKKESAGPMDRREREPVRI